METVQQPSPPVHIGIDVAKATLQADLQGKSRRFPNTRAGHEALLAALPDGAFAVLEATGSYHLEVTSLLQAAGIPVAVANPNLRVADAPLPLAEVFGVVRDTVAAQDAAAASGREVFRCA
mgnify:CR=1 FL=1